MARSSRMNLFFFFVGFITNGLLYTSLTWLNEDTQNKQIESHSNYKLAVVVPFSDRFDELLQFVPHISKFLDRQSITYKIFIVNQIDEYRFNRASLINVGFLEAISNKFDYIAMHDVDLLPLNDNLNYSYPSEGPFHVSASGLHPTYNYKTFIGGILIVNKFDFIKTNGIYKVYLK